MRVRQEGVDFVPCRIECDCMGCLFGCYRFEVLHGPGVEDVNDPRIADGDVEMPQAGVQKN